MIDQLAKQIVDDIQAVFKESEIPDSSRLKPLIESALRKLNLVTREEFDAQAEVLARTRKLLNELEKRLDQLENLP